MKQRFSRFILTQIEPSGNRDIGAADCIILTFHTVRDYRVRDVPYSGSDARTLRNSFTDWGRRHGGGVPSARHQARPRSRQQSLTG